MFSALAVLVLIALIFVVVFGVILHKTRFGLYTYAVGSNEESARRVGVKVDRQLISIYVLSGHERHQLRPRTRMTTVCVFNPPVTGREVHDENGVYPLITEVTPEKEEAS